MINYIVCENLRSAYNVGNIIRTADALGWGVIISGYTPHPFRDTKVLKTSLGAETYVSLLDFWNSCDAIEWARKREYRCIALETGGIPLSAYAKQEVQGKKDRNKGEISGLAVRVGNEREGLLPQTLQSLDIRYAIPMQGSKASLNVGQAAAIAMREMSDRLI